MKKLKAQVSQIKLKDEHGGILIVTKDNESYLLSTDPDNSEVFEIPCTELSSATFEEISNLLNATSNKLPQTITVR